MKGVKKCRRLISLLILCMCISFSLTACSKADKDGLDPENPISIEIWHHYNGLQKTAFDALVMEFNETLGAEKGIIVEAFSQGNVDALQRKVMESCRCLAEKGNGVCYQKNWGGAHAGHICCIC